MKIVFIALKGLPYIGGVEKYTDELGSRLVKKGHEVVIYTMKHNDGKTREYKGMKIIPIPTLQFRALDKFFIMRTASIAQTFVKNVDIVHYHGFQNSIGAVIPKMFGRKVVMQGHGIEWRRSRWSYFGRNYLIIYEKLILGLKNIFFNKATVVSNEQKEYYKSKFNLETTVIPTGVSEPQIEPPELIKSKYGLNGKDYILFAARLVREKGAHYLINAYNKIDTDYKLVIAGDAKHEEKYKNELKKLSNDNPNIIFTGYAQGKVLYELFSNAFIYVLPSEIEGLPISLLEAMSYSNACLSSNILPNIEASQNGKFGYHFKSEDQKDLKMVLEKLLNKESDLNEIGKEAQSHVLQNYTWDKIADKFEDLYSSLLERH
jgi:glycosyltransferase involved in cell wall biosynthesis